MSLVIITKTKRITKPISTSYNQLSIDDINSIVDIEEQNSQSSWSKNKLIESIQNSTNLCYSVSNNNQIIGFMMVMTAIDTADILNISISPEFQRMGYGFKLLNYLIEKLKRKKIIEILLEVRLSNLSAISFYLKHNFEKVSVRKNYYIKNSKHTNQEEDGIIMRLKSKHKKL